jgi:hypothetical protein
MPSTHPNTTDIIDYQMLRDKLTAAINNNGTFAERYFSPAELNEAIDVAIDDIIAELPQLVTQRAYVFITASYDETTGERKPGIDHYV